MNYIVLDYYVCFNKISEFIYLARTDITAMSLTKQFLLHEIQPKYPKIFAKIKANSKKRYLEKIKANLTSQRAEHISQINL